MKASHAAPSRQPAPARKGLTVRPPRDHRSPRGQPATTTQDNQHCHGKGWRTARRLSAPCPDRQGGTKAEAEGDGEVEEGSRVSQRVPPAALDPSPGARVPPAAEHSGEVPRGGVARAPCDQVWRRFRGCGPLYAALARHGKAPAEVRTCGRGALLRAVTEYKKEGLAALVEEGHSSREPRAGERVELN